jgi:hypothetical protein
MKLASWATETSFAASTFVGVDAWTAAHTAHHHFRSVIDEQPIAPVLFERMTVEAGGVISLSNAISPDSLGCAFSLETGHL